MEDSEDLFSVELLEQYNYTNDDNDTTECEFREGEEHLRTVNLFLGKEGKPNVCLIYKKELNYRWILLCHSLRVWNVC